MMTWQPGMTLAESEKQIILKALSFFQNNRTRTAAALDISVNTLRAKLKEYGVNTDDGISDAKPVGDSSWRDRLDPASLGRTGQLGTDGAVSEPPAAADGVAKEETPGEHAQDGIQPGAGDGVEPDAELPAQPPVSVPVGEEVQKVLPEHHAEGHANRRGKGRK